MGSRSGKSRAGAGRVAFLLLLMDGGPSSVVEYDGFSAVCTGAKDSDSPGFVSIQGEKGYMRIDGKPNVAPNLTIVITDDNSASGERDAAGAVVRAVSTEEFIPKKVHHRMTREFKDFAYIIDNKDRIMADRYVSETLGVMKVVG